jgi:hypothetical protein
VYNSGGTPGAYAASPVTFTADGSANVVVEYTAVSTTKTLSKVMFNAGTGTTWALATPTLQSELAACQRYYFRQTAVASNDPLTAAIGMGSGSSYAGYVLQFPVTMRAAPTATEYSGVNVGDVPNGTKTGTTITSQVYTTLAARFNLSTSFGALTSYAAYYLVGASIGSYIGFTAEL